MMPTGRFSDQPIELSRAIIEIDYVSVLETMRAILPSLHRELRRTGVRIMVVSPNMVRTAMGAGITPPAISGSISAAAVSKATIRGLDSGRFHVIVPRRFALILRLFTNLPLSWQDWIDDRADTHRIGLGGDPAERAKYLAGVLPTAKR